MKFQGRKTVCSLGISLEEARYIIASYTGEMGWGKLFERAASLTQFLLTWGYFDAASNRWHPEMWRQTEFIIQENPGPVHTRRIMHLPGYLQRAAHQDYWLVNIIEQLRGYKVIVQHPVLNNHTIADVQAVVVEPVSQPDVLLRVLDSRRKRGQTSGIVLPAPTLSAPVINNEAMTRPKKDKRLALRLGEVMALLQYADNWMTTSAPLEEFRIILGTELTDLFLEHGYVRQQLGQCTLNSDMFAETDIVISPKKERLVILDFPTAVHKKSIGERLAKLFKGQAHTKLDQLIPLPVSGDEAAIQYPVLYIRHTEIRGLLEMVRISEAGFSLLQLAGAVGTELAQTFLSHGLVRGGERGDSLSFDEGKFSALVLSVTDKEMCRLGRTASKSPYLLGTLEERIIHLQNFIERVRTRDEEAKAEALSGKPPQRALWCLYLKPVEIQNMLNHFRKWERGISFVEIEGVLGADLARRMKDMNFFNPRGANGIYAINRAMFAATHLHLWVDEVDRLGSVSAKTGLISKPLDVRLKKLMAE